MFLSRLVEWGQQSMGNAWRQSPSCVGWAATHPAAELATEAAVGGFAGDTAPHHTAREERTGAGGLPHVASLASVTTAGWDGPAAAEAGAGAGRVHAAMPPVMGGPVGCGTSNESASAVSSDYSTDMEMMQGGKGVWGSSGERV